MSLKGGKIFSPFHFVLYNNQLHILYTEHRFGKGDASNEHFMWSKVDLESGEVSTTEFPIGEVILEARLLISEHGELFVVYCTFNKFGVMKSADRKAITDRVVFTPERSVYLDSHGRISVASDDEYLFIAYPAEEIRRNADSDVQLVRVKLSMESWESSTYFPTRKFLTLKYRKVGILDGIDLAKQFGSALHQGSLNRTQTLIVQGKL